MKVLLTTMPKEGSAIQWVTPKYFQPDYSKYVPLGLLSLATNLPPNYEVKVFDPNSDNWGLEETINKIESEKPDILGLSTMTFSAYQMTQILKRTSAPYKTVGGPHATHYSDMILKQGADAVFIGQLADNDFASAIEKRSKGKIYCSTEINDIKFPDRSFIDLDSYFPKGNLFKSDKRMSMFSGVGCPYRCRFCDVQTKVVSRKKPEYVLDEMEYLKSIGAGSIHVYEDNFNTDENYIREVCLEMDRRGFSSEWSGRGRAKMSPEIAESLSSRGFKRIHVGFESLSDETLKWFRKSQNYAQIETFCNTMNQFNIDMIGFFIVGAPTETEQDRKEMASKLKNLGIKYPLVNILQPLPNTEYYRDLLNDGNYKEDYWSNFVSNPTPNFMIPFPYGEKKWKEDADFVEGLIKEIEKWKKERGE
jgi:anaerobic magnesium-protoporphyrin IX monomethyl ester cyclase